MKYIKRQEWIVDSELTLATIRSRLLAMFIDLIIIALLLLTITIVISKILKLDSAQFTWHGFEDYELKGESVNKSAMHIINICVGFFPFIYFFLFTYITNGQTIGKMIAGIKVAGIYHRRLSIWHSIERSLGYLASTAELGLGFIQVLWNPNKMALHDKIGETIVVKCRKKGSK
jgi:uncharacterized RDD family membrane protein YckC